MLLREVLELLQPANPAQQLRVYVDGTLGSGGHASMLMQAHKVSVWSCKRTQGERQRLALDSAAKLGRTAWPWVGVQAKSMCAANSRVRACACTPGHSTSPFTSVRLVSDIPPVLLRLCTRCLT